MSGVSALHLEAYDVNCCRLRTMRLGFAMSVSAQAPFSAFAKMIVMEQLGALVQKLLAPPRRRGRCMQA